MKTNEEKLAERVDILFNELLALRSDLQSHLDNVADEDKGEDGEHRMDVLVEAVDNAGNELEIAFSEYESEREADEAREERKERAAARAERARLVAAGILDRHDPRV